ncbi:TrkA family potassium uptake protein [Quadrisphaera sp. DSM 44207]|uniref:potassium channel family protein n=1 Tax=Quadrisphaera sp. DSM 44207 TaxID=1881057 RepID=UPI000891936F|nr:TrkA family potassium uptake protein [Quadrisphaera sp. DSM 44207]SDQ50038.1 trk system potassium uptake protein TrkA [Quadrisphaera sp. DSM 44207]
MHVVIMGCGRVGSALALSLQEHDHEVTVIDTNPDAFRRLGAFEGTTVTGVGFDRDVLREAGIERTDAFAAVSSGDNSNILAARVARENYGVSNVVARIYDPGRAEVYQRLGIPTVATVPWVADQVLRRLLPQGARSEYRDPSGELSLVQVHLHRSWVGVRLTRVEALTGGRVAFLDRFGRAELPRPDTVHQDGDQVHLLVPTGRVGDVEAVLAAPPEED